MRSLDYVWTVGTITLVIEQVNRDPLYVVHKEGFAHEWDELLYRNSPRVAIKGSYTSRKDIPRFEFKDDEIADDPDPDSSDQGEETEKQRPHVVSIIEYDKKPS